MHSSYINVKDLLPDFLHEFTNGFPNIDNNFGHFLLHLIFEGSQNTLQIKNGQLSTSLRTQFVGSSPNRNQESSNIEQFLKTVIGKYKPDIKTLITVDDLVPYFLNECAEKFLSIDKQFATYLLHLFIRDPNYGIDLDTKASKITVCKLENFLKKCLTKYADTLDATICNMKMSVYFKSRHELELEFVKSKYEADTREKLSNLIRSILQYPETSSAKQLEEMFVKMQIFILTNYSIGCPNNDVLLKQARQSLNSVLGKGDLQKYVLKKRYHRLEYLQRLGACVCGILTFNIYKLQPKNENIRNNLEMAQSNTKESLEDAIKRAALRIEQGTSALQKTVKIETATQNIQYLWAMIKLHEINKFIILFHVYKRCMEQMLEAFKKTQHQIDVAEKKFHCVIEKISETLKFRSAIESDLIFPHFVYLSEVWTSLILYLNHLVEINKIKDHLDALLSDDIENHYHALINDISVNKQSKNLAMDANFEELMIVSNKKESKFDMNKIKQQLVNDHCALSMVLTKGLLLPSQLQKQLCESLDLQFGFADNEFAKCSEHFLSFFIAAYRNLISSSADLILFLQLDDEVLQEDFDLVKQSVAKTKTTDTQTEIVIKTRISIPYQVNVTWNVWDYHRETIRLANIRQLQTSSTQSKASFGKKNSQNQTYNAEDRANTYKQN